MLYIITVMNSYQSFNITYVQYSIYLKTVKQARSPFLLVVYNIQFLIYSLFMKLKTIQCKAFCTIFLEHISNQIKEKIVLNKVLLISKYISQVAQQLRALSSQPGGLGFESLARQRLSWWVSFHAVAPVDEQRTGTAISYCEIEPNSKEEEEGQQPYQSVCVDFSKPPEMVYTKLQEW